MVWFHLRVGGPRECPHTQPRPRQDPHGSSQLAQGCAATKQARLEESRVGSWPWALRPVSVRSWKRHPDSIITSLWGLRNLLLFLPLLYEVQIYFHINRNDSSVLSTSLLMVLWNVLGRGKWGQLKKEKSAFGCMFICKCQSHALVD